MNRSTRSLLRAAAALAPAAVLLATSLPAHAGQGEIDRTIDEVLRPVSAVAAAPELAPAAVPAKALTASAALERRAAHRAHKPGSGDCLSGAERRAMRCPLDPDALPAGLSDTEVGRVVKDLDVGGLVRAGELSEVTRTLDAAPAPGRRLRGDHLPVPGTGVLHGVTGMGTVAPVLETVENDPASLTSRVASVNRLAENVAPADLSPANVLPGNTLPANVTPQSLVPSDAAPLSALPLKALPVTPAAPAARAKRIANPAPSLPLAPEPVRGVLEGTSGDPVENLLGGVTGSGEAPTSRSGGLVSGRLGGLAGGLTDTSALAPGLPGMRVAS
ncbi:hypothetical protein [Actinomadura hibisca]|uniref:hypothetical protein n=1 Tax=Actinomadura hibisca TaxID=68565 RepID=UPI000829C726|nr:hypothetical protein [Actinomadura hibisca]